VARNIRLYSRDRARRKIHTDIDVGPSRKIGLADMVPAAAILETLKKRHTGHPASKTSVCYHRPTPGKRNIRPTFLVTWFDARPARRFGSADRIVLPSIMRRPFARRPNVRSPARHAAGSA